MPSKNIPAGPDADRDIPDNGGRNVAEAKRQEEPVDFTAQRRRPDPVADLLERLRTDPAASPAHRRAVMLLHP